MNRQIQDKKVEIIGKKNMLLKESNPIKKQNLINQINKLEEDLSSLESLLAIQRAPSVPKTPTTTTSTLESRLASAREESFRNTLETDRLKAGLEDLRRLTESQSVNKPSFMDRLTQRLTGNSNNKKEITVDDLEDLLADVELPKGGKRRKKRKSNKKKYSKKRYTRKLNNRRRK